MHQHQQDKDRARLAEMVRGLARQEAAFVRRANRTSNTAWIRRAERSFIRNAHAAGRLFDGRWDAL